MLVVFLCVSWGPSDYPGALDGHAYLSECVLPVWDSVSLCPMQVWLNVPLSQSCECDGGVWCLVWLCVPVSVTVCVCMRELECVFGERLCCLKHLSNTLATAH